jgi:aspartate/glutamate racemase
LLFPKEKFQQFVDDGIEPVRSRLQYVSPEKAKMLFAEAMEGLSAKESDIIILGSAEIPLPLKGKYSSSKQIADTLSIRAEACINRLE